MKHIIKISLISLCLLFIVVGGITKLTAPIETVSADENNEIKIINIKQTNINGTLENINTSIYNDNHTAGFETSFADTGDYIEYKDIFKDFKILQLADQKESYNITNKHDKIFRTILDKKEEAVALINQAIKTELKTEEIEKYTSSFVNKIFENREADIVYKYENKNIFFLIEHQTKIDYSMPYRILEYEIEIMKSAIDIRKIKNKEYKLPLVIPIVL